MKNDSIWMVAMFATVLIPMSGYCALHYRQREQEGRGSESWPTVRGVITESVVVHSRDYDDTRIRYAYTVDGQQYIGRRIGFGHSTLGSLGNARMDVQKYPKGREVSVYFRPDDPAESALEPGTSVARNMYLSSLAVTIGAAALVLGCGAVLLLRRGSALLLGSTDESRRGRY
jgi:hypothetical protein